MGRQCQTSTNTGERRRGAPSIGNVSTPSRGGRGRFDTGSPTNALESMMRLQGVDEAWRMLEEMQQRGVTTDKFTVSRMLMKTVGDGRSRLNTTAVYRGIALVEQFIDLQPTDVDEVLFNALLDTCCRLKDLNRLEAIVRRMRDLKVVPSPVTLGILVKTYGQAGDLQKVLQVWDEMEKQRGLANAVTFGCMLDACVKCGNLAKALEIFQGMKSEHKHKNTILYTTLIKGYGLERELKNALALFQEMKDEGVPYNTITYNSIIDACIKCSDLPAAESLLRQMTAHDNNVKPDLITFSTLLKGYCHIGDIDKALQVAESIKRRGLRCDELVYNTLMDGCVKANDAAAGIGLFEEMIQHGMRPSSITHSILARLYHTAGFGDDAAEAVALLYHHHGLERPTGKSLQRRSAGGSSFTNSSSHQTCSSSSGASWDGHNKRALVYGFGQSAPSAADPSVSPTASCTPQISHSMVPASGLYLPIEALEQLGSLPRMSHPTCVVAPHASSYGGLMPAAMFASTDALPQGPTMFFECGSSPNATPMGMHAGILPTQCDMFDCNGGPMNPYPTQQHFVMQAPLPSPVFSYTDQESKPAWVSIGSSGNSISCTRNSFSDATSTTACQAQASAAEPIFNSCDQKMALCKAIHMPEPQFFPACISLPGRFGA